MGHPVDETTLGFVSHQTDAVPTWIEAKKPGRVESIKSREGVQTNSAPYTQGRQNVKKFGGTSQLVRHNLPTL